MAQRMGTIALGDFSVVNGGNAATSGQGNLYVAGNLTVGGTINGLLNKDEKAIQDLRAQNRELQDKVAWLESRIEQLWFAPGMPGAQMAQTDFDRLKDESRFINHGKQGNEDKYEPFDQK